MEFDRHDRARSLLMETIAEFIRTEANTNPLITVTNVDISPNYRHATVFFTTIPDTGEEDARIFLHRKGTELRQHLKKHARLKFIPEIKFEVDYGERHRQHIDEIARDIENRDS
jgi:ribosome-binding factor A